jgi:dCMP deaminase
MVGTMRPSKDETWLDVARLIAKRSTCIRRKVGCVLVDSGGYVVATGFNGVSSGMPHCNEPLVTKSEYRYPFACAGARSASGQNLDGCHAIHAEQNALIQADWRSIDTCYVTCSPCIQCVKMLMNTYCSRIVFIDEYTHEMAKTLWLNSLPSRRWEQISRPSLPPL